MQPRLNCVRLILHDHVHEDLEGEHPYNLWEQTCGINMFRWHAVISCFCIISVTSTITLCTYYTYNTYMYIYLSIYICTHIYIPHIHTHIIKYTFMHLCIYVYIQTCIHTLQRRATHHHHHHHHHHHRQHHHHQLNVDFNVPWYLCWSSQWNVAFNGGRILIFPDNTFVDLPI